MKSFEGAREIARALGLRTFREWTAWAKTDARPDDIPKQPHLIYRGKGWVDYKDWLGVNEDKPRIWSFELAREFVRRLKLRTLREWEEWAETDGRPPNIPARPWEVYEQWKGVADWLGYQPRWDRYDLLVLLEDLRPRLPYLEESELYAILHQGGAMPALRRHFGDASPLAVLKDL